MFKYDNDTLINQGLFTERLQENQTWVKTIVYILEPLSKQSPYRPYSLQSRDRDQDSLPLVHLDSLPLCTNESSERVWKNLLTASASCILLNLVHQLTRWTCTVSYSRDIEIGMDAENDTSWTWQSLKNSTQIKLNTQYSQTGQ